MAVADVLLRLAGAAALLRDAEPADALRDGHDLRVLPLVPIQRFFPTGVLASRGPRTALSFPAVDLVSARQLTNLSQNGHISRFYSRFDFSGSKMFQK